MKKKTIFEMFALKNILLMSDPTYPWLWKRHKDICYTPSARIRDMNQTKPNATKQKKK